VDTLLLVGGFSEHQYFFNRIWDAFHVRFHRRILRPRDADIATSLGAARSGLAQSLIQRPIGAARIIASKSYVIGIAANRTVGNEDNWKSSNGAAINNRKEVFEVHYVVTKGSLLTKGVPVFKQFTKTSYDSSDSIVIARLYSSDSAETWSDTSGGDLAYIKDWKIDLSCSSTFQRNCRNPFRHAFDTVFEIGIEIESREVHAVWFCDGKWQGRLRLQGSPRIESCLNP